MAEKTQKQKFEDSRYNNEDNLRDRLRNYILNTSNAIQNYGTQRKMYLNINITTMLIFASLLWATISYLSPLGKVYFGILFGFSSIYLAVNISNNLRERRTFREIIEDEFCRTNWFYRGNVYKKKESKIDKAKKKKEENLIQLKENLKNLEKKKNQSEIEIKKLEKMNNQSEIEIKKLKKKIRQSETEKDKKDGEINIEVEKHYEKLNEFNEQFKITKKKQKAILEDERENKLLRDDIKNLYILYCYQENYYSILKFTRINTWYSFTFTLVSVILGIVLEFLVFIPQGENGYIKTCWIWFIDIFGFISFISLFVFISFIAFFAFISVIIYYIRKLLKKIFKSRKIR